MEYLIKIAEWIIGLVRQKNGLLEKELELVTARYKEAQKAKASLEELFWKTDRLIIERQLAINHLAKKLESINNDYDDALEKGLIELKFIKDAVSELEELEALRQLGKRNE